MNIILIAAPGAGKGVLSESLKNDFGLSPVSAGEVLRTEIKSGSEIGNKVKNVVESGLLVDDTLLKELMQKRISSLDLSKGIILDGYPRKINQVKDCLEILEGLNQTLDYAFLLDVPKEESLKRALGRRNCPNCGKDFNVLTGYNNPLDGKCIDCNVELAQRTDDNEEGYSKRYDNYMNETEPMIKIFEEKGILVKIDATGSPEHTYEQVSSVLK